MTPSDYTHILHQLTILREVLEYYGDRTLENAITTLESRKKWYEENAKKPCNE